MPLKYRLPLVFFFSFLILVFSVDAHGPSPAHARRSLAFKKKLHRQLDLTGGLGDLVGDLLGGTGTTTTPGSSSSSTTSSDATSPPTTNPPTLTTSTDPPSTSSPATSTPSSSDTPSTSTSPSPTTDTSTSSTPSTTDPGSSSTSSSPSTDTPTSTPSTTTPTSSSSSPSPTINTSTSSTPLTCILDLLGNCASTSSPAVSSTSDTPVTTSTTPTPPLSSSSSPSPTDSPTTTPQQTTSTPSSTPASSSETPTPTLDCPLGVVVGGVCVLPSSSGTSAPPASTSNPPSTSEPPPSTSPPSTTPDLSQTSSSPSSTTPDPGSSSSPTPTPTSSSPVDPCGPVGILLGLCSSNSSPPVSTPPLTSTPPISSSPNPPESSSQSTPPLTSSSSQSAPPLTSSVSQSTPPLTSSPSQSVDPCGSLGVALGLCKPSVVPSSVTTSQSPSQSTDPCDSSGVALGLCTSSSSPPGSPSSSLPATITTPQPCGPLDLCSSTNPPNSGTQTPSGTVHSSGTLSGTQSQPSPSISQSSSLSGIPTGLNGSHSGSTSGLGSSSIPVISFPSGTNNSLPSTTSFSLTPTNDRPPPSFSAPPQSQLSYITDTSLLLLGSSVSSSLPATMSDPDAVPVTLSFAAPSNSPSASTPVVLPANLPARIYPPTPVDTSSLSGYSLVSILFESALSWVFVAQNTQSQGQIFLWMPSLIESALNLSSDQVKIFALQVFVPGAYTSPTDVNLLLTTCLVYIPDNQVSVLASQIRVTSSAFYQSLPNPYKALAAEVDPAFAVNSVQDPNVVPGTTSSLTSSGNKSRTDAIIGVASVLGGLALVVLGMLVYRSVKRSRDLRHRRLADPNAPNDPYPDRAGRDFDQDSIGGQRRRSFYFAEDSLRGQQAVQQAAVPVVQPQSVSQVEYSYRTSPDGVRERRAPVVTGAISAPILTQSSLNW